MLALAQQSNILDFPTVAPQGKSSEWYTPSRYIEAAREVMQGIDLDPASCYEANQVVKAKRYYTKQENGLAQEWKAKTVWINPPYSLQDNRGARGLFKSSIEQFTTKLLSHYRQGDIEQAILLATSQTDARWFRAMWEYPICFVDFRLKFDGIKINPKNSLAHTFGSIFVYLGPNEQKFIEVFSQFGTIAKRVSQPRHTIATPSLWEVAQ